MGAPKQRRLARALAVTLGAGLIAAPVTAFPAWADNEETPAASATEQTTQAQTPAEESSKASESAAASETPKDSETSAPASSEDTTPSQSPAKSSKTPSPEKPSSKAPTSDTPSTKPGAKSEPAAQAGETKTLNLLNINDFHGRIDENTVKFAGTVEGLKAEYPDSSAFLSAGDNIGASLFASSSQDDKPTLDLLNALDLKLSAVGNHEYDKGVSDLNGRVKQTANFPYLAANVTKNGKPVHDAYKIIEVDGVKVGVIGAITQETPSLVSPGGIKGLKYGDPVDAVNKVAKQLSDGKQDNGEADVLVAEYHEGSALGIVEGSGDDNSDESKGLSEALKAGGAFKKIVEETDPKIDVIFNGHTHSQYAWKAAIPGDKSGKTRPVLQTGSYGEHIGQVVLDYNTETKETTAKTVRNVARTETDDAELVNKYPRVEEAKGIVDAALKEAEEKGSVVIGQAAGDITTAFEGGERDDRSSESTLGNLVADSLLDTLSSKDRGGADIGVVNPGGLRSDLSKGNITYAQANAVLPFVNNLWTTTVTGAQFKEALEQQWQLDEDGKVPSRPYLQLGLSKNVTYTYDPDAKQGSHITSVTVNGAPLDMKKDYTVGSFSFLLQGGDNFRVFSEGKNTKDTGLVDRDAWIDYLKKESEESPVAPDFARHAVAVKGLPTHAVEAGSTVTVDLSKLDLTSKGSPANTKVEATLGTQARAVAKNLGTATVKDGAAKLSIAIPADASGDIQVQVKAAPSGTLVTLPIKVTAAATIPSENPGPTSSTDRPSDSAANGGAGEHTPSGTSDDHGHLANTGAEATPWIFGGAIAVMLGAALTVLGMRRRQH